MSQTEIKHKTQTELQCAPTLSETKDDHVPVYTLQNEDGYFPTGYSEDILTSLNFAQLLQMHPNYAREPNVTSGSTSDSITTSNHPESTLLAEGLFTLRDPAHGTPSEVALIGECNGILFYVKQDDTIVKTSSNEFAIIFPEDCIAIHILNDESTSDEIKKENDSKLLHLEALFAARTNFLDKTHQVSDATVDTNIESDIDNDIKFMMDNKVSKKMFKFSKYMSKNINNVGVSGANYIANYGEVKRNQFLEKSEKQTSTSTDNNTNTASNREVSPTVLYAAGALHKAGKVTNKVVQAVGTNVSNVIGKTMAGTLTLKENDSNFTKNNKKVALSSALVFYNLANSTTQAYRLMANAAKEETVEYMNVKYGRDASELARKTMGASIEFGEAALSARRFLNVKQIVKASAKVALKESIKK